MEALGAEFVPPSLEALESVIEYGLSGTSNRTSPTRVFADLWDIERFYSCACSPARAARLAGMNRTQRVAEPIQCPVHRPLFHPSS